LRFVGFEGLYNASLQQPRWALSHPAVWKGARLAGRQPPQRQHSEAKYCGSAILDALAPRIQESRLRQFLNAAGGLRVDGSAMPEQAELAEN